MANRRMFLALSLLAACVVPAMVTAACGQDAPQPSERPVQTGKPGSSYESDPGNYVEEPTGNMGKDAPVAEPGDAAHPGPADAARPGPVLSDIERKANEDGLKKTLERLAPGTRHTFVMMPLRDGTRLATDIFLPPEGDGPWPTLLLRSPYYRWGHASLAAMDDVPAVLVLQNIRGQHGSEAGPFDPYTFDSEINDGYDAIEWVAAQKWSNGKIGMSGASGSGMAPCNAMWSLAPHLTMIDVNITADNAYLHWTMNNGARRFTYSWYQQRGVVSKGGEWPRPTVRTYDVAAYHRRIAEIGPKSKAFYRMKGGWFDIFSEGALDAFVALAPSGRAYLRMDPGGHGPIGGDLTFKARGGMEPLGLKAARLFTLKNALTGKIPENTTSCLMYYLMGDGKDPEAPGNIYLSTDHWPVANTPTPYYLRKDGTLTLEAPAEKDAALSYDYDPRNPVPSLGGNYDVTDPKRLQIGPLDQRPLADRKDILRFATAPLEAPVGITGKVWLELHVSSDCPDTMFTMKLVDVYPDGYQAVIRESAMLARCWTGEDKHAPLEKGKVYKLSMDCWSTAIVFAKGHRIAVHVSSSSEPAYEVHPNTYEPAESIDEAKVAHNTVHLSVDHASKLVLPVVDPETYMN